MHEQQTPYVKLYEALLGYQGKALHADVLSPWLAENITEIKWLKEFAAQSAASVPAVDQETLWRLYALSRVNDLLLMTFQATDAHSSDWAGPPITPDEYRAFMIALGMTELSPPPFSPFYYEIVTATPASEKDTAISVTEVFWPGMMLGNMLFSRAGVSISGGSDFLNCITATSSMLYWTFRRKYRPYQDLSHGWGGNSQWRTRFRRDYHIGENYHFNVDGKYDLANTKSSAMNDEDLSVAERIELLTNRCFIHSEKNHNDHWPYDDKIIIQSPES